MTGQEEERSATSNEIDITSLRSTVASLQSMTGELLSTDEEVDNDLEFAGLQKVLDGGPALLFNRVAGYPDVRLVTNLFAKESRMNRIFGFENNTERTKTLARLLNEPIPPVIVESDDAPVQQNVVTDFDVADYIPEMRHSPPEAELTVGSGCGVVYGEFFDGGSHVGYNRMNFRWDNVSSFNIAPGSHMWMISKEHYGDTIPITMNLGISPAMYAIAGAGNDYPVLPKGCDEVGLAGALQGSPVELVEAQTVDGAYAVANAEITLEGYIDPKDRRYETAEAEEADVQGEHPFHPEWPGYMGNAWKTPTFHVTGVTHRDFEDRPMIHQTIVRSMECTGPGRMLKEAAYYELCERIQPDIVTDVNMPFSFTPGVVFEIEKSTPIDEGYQRNFMVSVMGSSPGLRLAIAVDSDVNIYSVDDLLWALSTRVNPQTDIIHPVPGGRGQAFQPTDKGSGTGFEGGIVIDATVPYSQKGEFQRPAYPVDDYDPTEWFDEDAIERSMADADPYMRFLAEKGW